jgi:hypothetical protein
MFAVVICAEPTRRAYLENAVATYKPNAGNPVQARAFATTVEAVSALAAGPDKPAFIVYSLTGGGSTAKDLPLLGASFGGAPIIVEFPASNDDAGEALRLVSQGVYNVYSERINRVDTYWDMFTRAIGKIAPYEKIANVAQPSPNWGFMSMVFTPGSLDLNEYLSAIRPVTDSLGLELRRVDEVPSTVADLRERVQKAIKARDVLVAQMSTQSSNTMYEIGYADAVRKTVILLHRTGSSDIPALLNGLHRVEYSTSVELAMRLHFGLR